MICHSVHYYKQDFLSEDPDEDEVTLRLHCAWLLDRVRIPAHCADVHNFRAGAELVATLVALCPVHAIQVASSVFFNIVYLMMITDAIWK